MNDKKTEIDPSLPTFIGHTTIEAPMIEGTEFKRIDATPEGKTAALYAALARARLDVGVVEKDGQVKGQGSYTYASAQAIMAIAGPVLANQGLSFFPITSAFDEEKMIMHRQYLLTHALGGELAIASETPVVIVKFSSGNSTARDKAIGAAKTVDLRYALRDLLNLPQVDDAEDIEKRAEGVGYAERTSRPGSGREGERPQQQSKPNGATEPHTESKAAPSQPDIDKRKIELRERIKAGRAELGAELVQQLGIAAEPKNMQEAELLATKIDAAVAQKKSKGVTTEGEAPKEGEAWKF